MALVGYGLSGRVFHAPLIAGTPGIRLDAVVTSDPDRQERARLDHPEARVLPHPEAVWEEADRFDAVVVAAANRAHLPIGLAALEAGLAVVMEKPMASSAAGGRRLVAAAEDRGVLLTVFHNRRWDGDFLTVSRLIAEGALGSVGRFESRFERWRPEPRPGVWRESGAAEDGGGLLFDLGSHLVDQAMILFGRPTGVYAETDRRRPGVEVDDDAFVALTHPLGVRSHLWMSSVAARPGPRLRVLGSRAAYEKFGLDPQEDRLRAGERPGGPEWGSEPRDRWGLLFTGGDSRPIETERGRWPDFYSMLVKSLYEQAPPPVDPLHALEVLEVLEAARESAGSSRVVALAAR